MGLFANENKYDSEITAATAVFSAVPPAIVKAVMAAESAFNPDAKRGEPQLGDASYGLMQLLYKTAQRLGYTGPEAGLLYPMTSVYFGTKLLAENYKTLKNWPDAISAYNGGIRPEIAFGRVATKPLTNICLWWKAPGVCGQRVNVAVGKYANQTYVDKVLRYRDYYAGKPLEVPKPGQLAPSMQPKVAGPSGGTTPLLLLLGLGGALLAMTLRRG
jgi:soluble lytic murein transglycosylase-like protein